MTALAIRDRSTVHALAVWLVSRAVVAFVALVVVTGGWLAGWYHWDVALYIKVARFGYGGFPERYPDNGIAAFFPGFPFVLRAVHTVVPSWVAAGLLISFVAGAVACVALARLAAREPGGRAQLTGPLAVLALVVSPYAVFLSAGYSESLFLAFALPAWLAARRRSWVLAGVLAAAAATVRVTGLFLAMALIVEYATSERRWRRDSLALLLPAVPAGLFMVHLHEVQGDWLAWPHAQSEVWGRHFTAPWDALQVTWDAARNSGLPSDYVWQFRADIAAMAIGVALTLALLLWRRWGEATYVGLQVAALATSSFYLSVGRATLLWWPLWLLLGRVGARRPWLFAAYVVVAAPLMVVQLDGFVTDRWVG